MRPVFVLVHSPSVGPLTWGPVADALAVRHYESVIPSLLDVADADPPFWPRVVDLVNVARSRLDQDQCVLLVANSNAGLFGRCSSPTPSGPSGDACSSMPRFPLEPARRQPRRPSCWTSCAAR
jgi:hypothetical protein